MEHATQSAVRAEHKIMIVEDQTISARGLQMILDQAGYHQTLIAGSGEEALKTLADQPVDLILMDIGLNGGLDGVETARRILAQNDIAIVYLTGSNDEAIMERARETHPYGYLMKPFHHNEMLVTVDLALYLHRMQKEAKLSFNWLMTTLNSLAHGVIATDDTGMIRFMNPEAENLTGWPLMESAGKPVSDILDLVNETTHEHLDRPVSKVLEQGKELDMPHSIAILSRTGAEIPIQATICPIFNGTAQIYGAVLIFRNAGESKKERDHLLNLLLSAETEKRSLERYFPENLVDRLVDEGHLAELGGKNIPITVMFCDLRSSTAIAEMMSPGEYAALLSDFFSGMMDLAYANGGSVNKLIGDGMLITFGCPIPEDGDATSCVKLALQFRQYVIAYNGIKPDYLHADLAMGIGIATGTVFAGNIGCARHMEYTVLGDPVNIASRLEKLTKELGRDIAIDRNTFERLSNEIDVSSLGFHRLIGKKEAVEVFFPEGMA